MVNLAIISPRCKARYSFLFQNRRWIFFQFLVPLGRVERNQQNLAQIRPLPPKDRTTRPLMNHRWDPRDLSARFYGCHSSAILSYPSIGSGPYAIRERRISSGRPACCTRLSYTYIWSGLNKLSWKFVLLSLGLFNLEWNIWIFFETRDREEGL